VSLRSELARALDAARAKTLRLSGGLGEAELRRQYDPLFSPIGWHVGHVAWQEECWALRRAGGEPPIDASLDDLFDSFESKKHQRGGRLATPVELFAYAECVRERTLALLQRADLDAEDELLGAGYVFRFLANHERQHAEIIGVVRTLGELYLQPAPPPTQPRSAERDFIPLAGGRFAMGGDGDPDSWDNERPAREVTLVDYRIMCRPVENAAWLEFMRAGGYEDDRLWTPKGAKWKHERAVRAPLFWHRAGDGWQRRSLGGVRPVEPERAVCHVSWHEAQAFTRFAGARLPSEAEWEHAASWDAVRGRKNRWPWGDVLGASANLGLATLDATLPGEVGEGTAASGVEDMAGGVWEWTADVFEPYPGFSSQPYRGYSQPWFDGRHRVARGGSFLTQPEIARSCFRNFYLPEIRQVPLGLRLAQSGAGSGS